MTFNHYKNIFKHNKYLKNVDFENLFNLLYIVTSKLWTQGELHHTANFLPQSASEYMMNSKKCFFAVVYISHVWNNSYTPAPATVMQPKLMR